MNPLFARHPQRACFGRFVFPALILGLLAGGWFVVRPILLYQAARISLGLWERSDLVWQAVSERLQIRPPATRAYSRWLRIPYSYSHRTARIANAIVSVETPGAPEFAADWIFVDQDLNPRYRIRSDTLPATPPADRDGDGEWEIMITFSDTRPPPPGTLIQRNAVIRLGKERHELLAVVEEVVSTAITNSMWTRGEGSTRDELSWVTAATGPSGKMVVANIYRLSWTADGLLAPHGAPPARVWLAEPGGRVTFGQDERIESVVERVMP